LKLKVVIAVIESRCMRINTFEQLMLKCYVHQPSCLELTARTLATNHFNRTFQALSKNVFIRADIALSALETFLFNGLYKFTLLTYLLTVNVSGP